MKSTMDNMILHPDIKFHKLSRKVEKQSVNVYARLKSIEFDSLFAKDVCNTFESLPVFANLRCGQWYLPKFDGTCYFKSTDGHTYNWRFPTTRLNLQVAIHSSANKGIIILDSTRKGKKFPDSFSKTIPIWSCVINMVVAKTRGQEHVWDTNLHLPVWIHPSEKDQITEKLNTWTDNLMKSGVDLSVLSKVMTKPLRCIWISQNSDLESLRIAFKSFSFTPLFLVSTSDPDYIVKSNSWHYIQGAGDDHQGWSLGLTPKLFWDNKDFLLEGELVCEERVRDVVREFGDSKINLYHSGSIAALQIYTDEFTKIANTNLFIGSNPNVCDYTSSFTKFGQLVGSNHVAIISCVDDDSDQIDSDTLLVAHIMDHKRRRDLIPKNLPRILSFIRNKLSNGYSVLILCKSGNNESIGVCCATLCAMFDDNTDGFVVTPKEVTKELVLKRFTFIQSFVNTAAPTQNTIKSISRFFTYKSRSKSS
ncbi:tRNA A64-2'-O-ribosyl phosphate transferase [Acrasis kona]|uniref:tRNA A64-2'-O-ribosyl phosphate transferase n=1 Tax=Acrasis kona TaxID=1008807 RepID=A0AAW2Z7Q0_9EUKA